MNIFRQFDNILAGKRLKTILSAYRSSSLNATCKNEYIREYGVAGGETCSKCGGHFDPKEMIDMASNSGKLCPRCAKLLSIFKCEKCNKPINREGHRLVDWYLNLVAAEITTQESFDSLLQMFPNAAIGSVSLNNSVYVLTQEEVAYLNEIEHWEMLDRVLSNYGKILCDYCSRNDVAIINNIRFHLLYDKDLPLICNAEPNSYVDRAKRMIKEFADNNMRELNALDDELLNHLDIHDGLTDDLDERTHSRVSNGNVPYIAKGMAAKMMLGGIKRSIEIFVRRVFQYLGIDDIEDGMLVRELTPSNNGAMILVIIDISQVTQDIDENKIQELFENSLMNKKWIAPSNLQFATKAKDIIKPYSPKLKIDNLDIGIDEESLSVTAELTYKFS